MTIDAWNMTLFYTYGKQVNWHQLCTWEYIYSELAVSCEVLWHNCSYLLLLFFTGSVSLALAEKSVDNDVPARMIYLEACKDQGVIPVSYFLRHLNDTSLDLKHHGLGAEGMKPLAVALIVSNSVETPPPLLFYFCHRIFCSFIFFHLGGWAKLCCWLVMTYCRPIKFALKFKRNQCVLFFYQNIPWLLCYTSITKFSNSRCISIGLHVCYPTNLYVKWNNQWLHIKMRNIFSIEHTCI